jgi:hypothetical protein
MSRQTLSLVTKSFHTQDDDFLTTDEYSLIKAIHDKLESGDDSDFLDWDEVKEKLTDGV